MSKKIEEESNRTVAEPAEKAPLRSKDAPDEEIEENTEIEKQEPTEPLHLDEEDDPRAAIYARHSQRRDGETDENTPEINDGDPENPEIEVEKEDSTDIIDEDPADSPKEETVEVLVLGELRQVPQKKIDDAGGIENYQIRIAAQYQMEQNAHERKRLEQERKELDERERRIAALPATDGQPGNPNPDDLPSPDGQTLEEMARQYQEAVYDGDDNAPSILAKMVALAGRTGQKVSDHVDPEALRRQVKEDVLADQRQAKIVKASHTLIEAHPELNERDTKFDPRLFTAVDDETQVVERQHPDWEPEQVVQEAYNRIAKWRGTVGPTDTIEEKRKDKQEMRRPRTGTQRFTPPPPAPRQTNSGYVESIRKARGLE